MVRQVYGGGEQWRRSAIEEIALRISTQDTRAPALHVKTEAENQPPGSMAAASSVVRMRVLLESGPQAGLVT